MSGPSQSVGERLLMIDESPYGEATATDDTSYEPALISHAASIWIVVFLAA
jgi:hypothetical protein